MPTATRAAPLMPSLRASARGMRYGAHESSCCVRRQTPRRVCRRETIIRRSSTKGAGASSRRSKRACGGDTGNAAMAAAQKRQRVTLAQPTVPLRAHNDAHVKHFASERNAAARQPENSANSRTSVAER